MGRARESAAKLLAVRQEMLVLFCRVAGLDPYGARRSLVGLLTEFRQILIDYIAMGHFDLYHAIVVGAGRGGELHRLAEQVYPGIAHGTEIALRFNDKYEDPQRLAALESLEDDLSLLGESLANRIELEDRLIAAL